MSDSFLVTCELCAVIGWFFSGKVTGGGRFVTVLSRTLYTFMGILTAIVFSPILLIVFIIELIVLIFHR